jgi:hypothetical protein
MVSSGSGIHLRRKKVMDRVYTGIAALLMATIMLCWVLSSPGEEPDMLRRKALDWYVSFGGVRSDAGYDILETSDAGLIVSGVTNSFGTGFCDVYVVKTDSLGKLQWERTYGGKRSDYGNSICSVDGGGYVIVGSTWSFGAGEADAYFIRIDEKGNEVWSRTFGGKLYERASSVKQTLDGGFIIAGWTTSFGSGGVDIFLLKLDENGYEQWRRTYGGALDDYGYTVNVIQDSGFVIAGSSLSFGLSRTDAYVIKTDHQGKVKWSKFFGGAGDEFGRSIIQTADGGFLLAGYTNSFGLGAADAYFVKMDSLGDTLWTKTYGGEKIDGCASVVASSHGGFAATGWTNSFGGGELDIYFIEMDSLGALKRTWTSTRASLAKASAVVNLRNGGFAITGFSFSYETRDADLFLLKLLP